MPARNCPKCRALNAEDATVCNLCGRTLMPSVEADTPDDFTIITDAGRWVGPHVPAPLAVLKARQAAQERRPRQRKPTPRSRHHLPHAVYMLAGMGLGALLGAVLVFAVGLIDEFAFGGQAHSMLPVTIGDLPPLCCSVAAGAVVGAIVGALTAGAENIWVGMAVFTALCMTLEGARYHGTASFSGLVITAAGGWGAFYGYLVSAGVRRLLQDLLFQAAE